MKSSGLYRWGVAIALAAGVTSARAVRAETPVYADLNGMCGGKSPCFTTIQQAVNAASDPDGNGPAFAEVFVFPGVYFESVHIETMAVIGDIRLTTVDAAGAPTPGTAALDPATGPAIWNAVFAFPGRVTIDGLVVTSTNADAVNLLTTADIVVANVQAHDAGSSLPPDPSIFGGAGMVLVSSLGDITVRNSIAQRCREDGVFASSELGAVTFDAVETSENGNAGIKTETGDDVFARDCRSAANARSGIDFATRGNVSIERCEAEGNRDDGIAVFAREDVAVMSSTALGNLREGFEVISELGMVALDGLTAQRHEGNGIAVIAAGDVLVSNSSSTRSELDGILVEAGSSIALDSVFSRQTRTGYRLVTPGDVQITNAAAEGCTIGCLVAASGSIDVDRLTAMDGTTGPGLAIQPSAAGEFVRGLSVRNSLLANNSKHAGILLNQLSPSGSHVIIGSIICGNNEGGAGLMQPANSTATVDARGNWWGDVSGPSRPNKPPGPGDGVDAGGGEILVDPWIDQITAIASAPTATLADEVVVQFQFRHSGSERFLGQGPGAIGGRRPFIVTTDNGTVKSQDGTAGSIGAFITDEKGNVAVIAKGAAEGLAKVELSGLCFAQRSVTVELKPAPEPQPEPEPEPQPNANTQANNSRAPFCGAGVPAMAALSAVGLFAVRPLTRSRRRLTR